MCQMASKAIQQFHISMYNILLMEKVNSLNAKSIPTLEEIVIGLLTKEWRSEQSYSLVGTHIG